MKDKLRELAEWMRDVNGHCAYALTEILDAEGDGGATWWTTKDGAEPMTSEQKAYKISLGYPASHSASHYNVPLYTHPARSGVVSEEGVIAAARELCKRNAEACGVDHRDNWNLYAEDFTADARAALESFMENRK